MPPRVLLLTGTVGVGKTSVLLEIGEQLALAGAPYALVDLDWLAWLRPSAATGATVQGVLTENLSLVAGTFRRAGVERLVLAARCAGRTRSRPSVPPSDRARSPWCAWSRSPS